jgi:hypothetical protein
MSYIEVDPDIWVVLNAPIVKNARVFAAFSLLPPVLPTPGEVILPLTNNCSVCYSLACDGIKHCNEANFISLERSKARKLLLRFGGGVDKCGGAT